MEPCTYSRSRQGEPRSSEYRLPVAPAALTIGGVRTTWSAALTLTMLLLAGAPGWADVPPPPAFHPENDQAGSQILANETHENTPMAPTGTQLLGLDASHHQPQINWPDVAANGATFAYLKATEGTDYQDPAYGGHAKAAVAAGLVRGAYHFALPDRSSATVQATFFVAHGGGWTADGKTLPPMLDIEYNPYGDRCYGMNPAAMRTWIGEFSGACTPDRPVPDDLHDHVVVGAVHRQLGRSRRDQPAVHRALRRRPRPLPAGWSTWTFWQFANKGKFPGDQDTFNGLRDRLTALANG